MALTVMNIVISDEMPVAAVWLGMIWWTFSATAPARLRFELNCDSRRRVKRSSADWRACRRGLTVILK